MSQTIVVIPCYNEAARLDVRRFHSFARRSDMRLLLVNDGSRDDTLRLLRDMQLSAPGRFLIHNLSENVGKAEAVRQGFQEAFRHETQFVAYWDADLATPLETLEQFRDVLRRRSELLLVMGSRMPLLGHRISRSRVRRWLSRTFTMAASCALGIRIQDTQCGAKMFRVTPQIQHVFRDGFLSRWIFDVEILARLIQGAPRGPDQSIADVIYEYPLEAWHDVGGSKLRLGDFGRAVLELAAIYRTYGTGRQLATLNHEPAARGAPRAALPDARVEAGTIPERVLPYRPTKAA